MGITLLMKKTNDFGGPMKIKDIINEEWSEESPLENTPYPLDMWDNPEADQLRRYSEIKKSPRITHSEAEMLIAADKELFSAIDEYKVANVPILNDVSRKLLSIMKRIIPIDKTFYRGVDHEGYDDKHIMKIQSWSPNILTVAMFGDTIYRTVGGVVGFEIGQVYYWHGSLYGDVNGLGDSQAEWLLLNPKKELNE